MTRAEVNERADLYDHDILVMDEHDNAIVGMTLCGRVIYSQERIYQNLEEAGMTRLEAMEYFDYNIVIGHGEGWPVYLDDVD